MTSKQKETRNAHTITIYIPQQEFANVLPAPKL